MVKRPPHVLVTTPESLYLILTSERARDMLRTVRTVIVDEIHAVARDKRGSHLALSLERLERSEEHTSELQSPCNLVCRLLLEKKKKNTIIQTTNILDS